MKDIATLQKTNASITETGYAKINLALDVTGRLDNGYHLVKMIMESISISDTITITVSDKPGIRLTCNLAGIATQEQEPELSAGDDNLIVRAARSIMLGCGVEENKVGLDILLKKNIPMAAGMAGGSSDAAATLRGMNKLFEFGLSEDELCEIGVKLGADIPYCIKGGSYLSEGIGEILSKLPSPPKAKLLIIKPNIDVSTKYVYENLDNNGVEIHPDVDGMIDAIKGGNLEGITARLGNVLRDVTINRYPIVSEIEDFMKANGAMNALMSGSGPTVFGIFSDAISCENALIKAKEKYSGLYVQTAEFVS